jgi:hypothetical protein
VRHDADIAHFVEGYSTRHTDLKLSFSYQR